MRKGCSMYISSGPVYYKRKDAEQLRYVYITGHYIITRKDKEKLRYVYNTTLL